MRFAATDPTLNTHPGIASYLGFAAAPAFALMAWISAFNSPGLTICGGASLFAPINEMALMYLLMGVFHLPPWLRLISQRPATTQHPQGD